MDKLIDEDVMDSQRRSDHSDEEFLLNEIVHIINSFNESKVEIVLFTYNCLLDLTKITKFVNSNEEILENIKVY